jgi:hypothetical protein
MLFALLALGVGAAASTGALAQSGNYINRITVKTAKVFMENNRARVVLNVFNGNSDVLDIEVTCDFFSADNKPAGSGHNTVSRLAPRRTDTVMVANEMAVDVDSATCAVSKAVK